MSALSRRHHGGDRQHHGGLPLEGGEDRLEPVHLIAVGRERHQHRGGDAGFAPLLDPFADARRRAIQSAGRPYRSQKSWRYGNEPNALEAMAGSRRRELAVTTTLLDDETIEIAVADSGPGLAKKVSDRLFEPFVSTNPTAWASASQSAARSTPRRRNCRMASPKRPPCAPPSRSRGLPRGKDHLYQLGTRDYSMGGSCQLRGVEGWRLDVDEDHRPRGRFHPSGAVRCVYLYSP
jgi:hypothetical protein